jgi:hypothetical protein
VTIRKINGNTYSEFAIVAAEPIPVDIEGATLSLTADGVEIKNDVGNPIPVNDAGGSLTVDSPQLTSIDGKLPALVGGRVPVDVAAISLGDVEIKNDTGNPIPVSVAARTPTTTSVASSATSVTILAANANRKGFSISNVSTAKLYLSFTNPATTTNAWIEVPAGAFLLLDQQLIVGNAIYGIWASANGTAQVTEYV